MGNYLHCNEKNKKSKPGLHEQFKHKCTVVEEDYCTSYNLKGNKRKRKKMIFCRRSGLEKMVKLLSALQLKFRLKIAKLVTRETWRLTFLSTREIK